LLYPIRICTSFLDGWIDAMKLLHTEIKTFTKIKCTRMHPYTYQFWKSLEEELVVVTDFFYSLQLEAGVR